MRIALTGAGGFLGPHLTRAATSRGIAVTGLVRKESQKSIVAEAGGRPALVQGLEAEALRPAFSGADAVVHLAQISGERNGSTYEAVNVLGTRNVIAACRSEGVPSLVLLSGLGVARYGISPRSTNGYFLSKLASEVEAFRSDLASVVVFRPSYIAGLGDLFMASLLREFDARDVAIVGDGLYRLQPLSVKDACDVILLSLSLRGRRVFDLVGPEKVTYRSFVSRVARALSREGEVFREISVGQADAEAAQRGAFRGLLKDELDVLLCDEVSDEGPIEALLGRRLMALDDAIRAAVGDRGERR
jgi:nucleoside-diphosphate-sugar epimerase